MSEMIVTIAVSLFLIATLPMVIAPFLRPTTRGVSTSLLAEPRQIQPVTSPVAPNVDGEAIAA